MADTLTALGWWLTKWVTFPILAGVLLGWLVWRKRR